MKKLISISFAALAMGTMFTTLPAQASGGEDARFCDEHGELTTQEDILLALQNFIVEIENLELEDLTALTEIGSRVDDGEDLESICNSL